MLSAAGSDGDMLGIAEYSVDDAGHVSVSAAELITLDAPDEADEAAIYDAATGGDGLFYVLTGNERENYAGDFAVLRYTADGTFQDKMSITGFPESAYAGLAIAAGSSDRMVLMGDNYVYTLLWQGAPTNRQTIERTFYTCAACTSQGIVLSIHNLMLDASPFYSGGLSMAIPANSQNKDGAWAFIKERLSLDSQLNLGEMSALPVNYEALKRLAEASSTEEGRAELYSLLDKTKYAETFSDCVLQNIIISAGQAYINGDKPLGETVNLIQLKASIYLAEQYG